MKQKRGRPRKPPIESPHWIAYEAALEEAIERFQSKPLAINKLNRAFAAGKIQCKFESFDVTEIVARDVPVTAEYYAPEEKNQGDDEPEIHVDGQLRTGWLFLWKPDLNKFFGISAKPAQAVTVKKQQTRAAVGHPVVHDWREITLIIARLHRGFWKLTCNALVGKVQEYLAEARITVPADSELQKAVKQVMGFEERHAQQLKQFSETQ